MNKYRKMQIIPTILIFVLLLYRFYYISLSARDVVFMDFWRSINSYIEPVMNGSLSWDTLWEAHFGQRNFFQMLLVAFNIKYTGMNCIWESYAGMIMIACTDVILLQKWIELESNGVYQQNQWNYYLVLPVLVIPFCLQQWEILSLQFSFAFMTRICCYYLIMAVVDKLLHENAPVRDYVLSGVFTALVVAFVSQLYWPALLFTLFVAWGVDCVRNKMINITKVLAYWGPVLIGVILYLYGATYASDGGDGIITIILSAKYWMAILYMFPGSLIPLSVTENLGTTKVIFISIVLILFVIISVILYFKFHLEKNSYFPMMLCAYGLFSIGIISYGRITVFDYTYMLSSRYTCETMPIWVGIALCYAFLAKEKKITYILPVVAILFLVGYADKTEMIIAPYRGFYKDELLSMMPKLDSYSDEELAGFQSPPELVREGNRLLQKYSLNIYRDLDLESQIIENE